MEKAFQLAQQLKNNRITPADLRSKRKIDEDKLFVIAYAYYLLGITNERTREQYKRVIDHFIRYMTNVQGLSPLKAIGLDVSLWRDDMVRTGGVCGYLSGANLDRCVPQERSSVHTKVSILSAFYKFLQKPGLDGSPPLISSNPVEALRDRFKIEKYGRSKKISIDSLKKIVAEINMSTIKGLRDYALIYGYFITGRRNSEWLTLTWGQLNFNTTPPTYSFVRKGQKDTVDELPEVLLETLIKYLRMRWGGDFDNKLGKDTHLFTAMPGRGGVRQLIDPNQPLTRRSMLRIVKNYAKQAGLDESQITVHSLRHLHAETYLASGASVEEVRARLWHQSLATTQRYASSMTNEENRLADKLNDLLVEKPDQAK